MEHLLQPEERPTADDLLSKGYWKTTRSQHTPARYSASNLDFLDGRYRTSHQTTEVPAPALLHRPRRRRNWPPPPCCEDEFVALSKELLEDGGIGRHIAFDEPPFRGALDQHPVILEIDVSPAEAARLQEESQFEDSGERRFVILPGSNTTPWQQDLEDERQTATNKKRNATISDPSQSSKHDVPTHCVLPPLLERRRSTRQDLPALHTKLAPDMPAFRRSTSAYASSPKIRDSAKTIRTPSADYLLSTGAVPSSRLQTQESFTGAASALHTDRKDSSRRLGTPIVEKRRSREQSPSISRPTTPTSGKRYSGGSDSRRFDHVYKSSRTPQSAYADVNHGATTKVSHSIDTSEREYTRKSRASSTQPSGQYYVSSDEDLGDSSDSDREEQRYYGHNHRRMNLNDQLDDDRVKAQRTTTRADSHDVKPSSRHPSPRQSPKGSPSQVPPVSRRDPCRKDTYPQIRESHRQNSRPVSPLPSRPDSPRSSTSLKPPNEILIARSSSRQSSPAPGRKEFAASTLSAALPVPVPTRIDLLSPGETRHSPAIPAYGDNTAHRQTNDARSANSPQLYWQPPKFQPTGLEQQPLDRSMGSYRRYSQDIEDGTIAPLPTCPRRVPVRGYVDWLTLPNCTGFKICPSCFTSTIMPTEFAPHFVPAASRSPREEIMCDFGSQPWYRIAWLLALKERRKDLDIIYRIADILTTSSPCEGLQPTVRKFYSVLDPSTGLPVANFDVCSTCVKSIETLLPALRSLFVRVDIYGPPELERTCDMRFDSKRFVHYFDALEIMADLAKSRHRLNTQDFVNLTKRYAIMPECTKDIEQQDRHWYMITQLPEFTVCDECFDEVIVPELEKRKAIPAMFTKSRHPVSVASCQLYSERMRDTFRKAVSNDDYKLLAFKARERSSREIQYKKAVLEQRRLGRNDAKSSATEMRRLRADWEKWE